MMMSRSSAMPPPASSQQPAGGAASGTAAAGGGPGIVRRSCLPHSSLIPHVRCAVRCMVRPPRTSPSPDLEPLYDDEDYYYDGFGYRDLDDDGGDEKKDGESGLRRRGRRRRRHRHRHDDELRVTATLYGMSVPLHVEAACASTRVATAATATYTDTERDGGGGVEGGAQAGGGDDEVVASSASAAGALGVEGGGGTLRWDDVLDLPVRWRDLTRDACIGFNVVGPSGEQLWGTTLSLFDRNGLLRNGKLKLRLYPDVDADGTAGGGARYCSTPGLAYSMPSKMNHHRGGGTAGGGGRRGPDRSEWWTPYHMSAVQARERLHRVPDGSFDESEESKEMGYGLIHEAFDSRWTASLILERLEAEGGGGGGDDAKGGGGGDAVGAASSPPPSGAPSAYWLDDITRARCRDIVGGGGDGVGETSSLRPAEFDAFSNFIPPGLSGPEADLATSAYLTVQLPVFPLPVVHEDTFYPHSIHGASGSVTALDLSLYRRRLAALSAAADSSSPPDGGKGESAGVPSNMADDRDVGLSLVEFFDPEDEEGNPVEEKYRTLAHDLLRGLVDPSLKPDREQRARIAAILASPSHHLTREEKDLLWRFRFSLVDNRRALTKFLLAVDWMEEGEVVQAAELLEQWRKRSPIEVTDALKLLGKHVAFQTSLVRSYAIDTLASAPDDELQLYLLQLVQALKYEDANGDEGSHGLRGSRSTNMVPSSSLNVAPPGNTGKKAVSSLAQFLIDRASKNVELANFLYWYLKVEMSDGNCGERYGIVFAALKEKLRMTPAFRKDHHSTQGPDYNDANQGSSLLSTEGAKSSRHAPFSSIFGSVSKLGSSLRSAGSDEGQSSSSNFSMWNLLTTQDKFITGIMECQMESRDVRGKKDAKETHLKSSLSTRGFHRIKNQEAVPLPSEPHVMVSGVNPLASRMFKSALYPALIEFRIQADSSSCQTNDLAPGDSQIEVEEADHVLHVSKHASGKQGLLDKARGKIASPSHHSNSTYKVIVKTGDDLRQDQLVMMMMKLMDGLLKRGTLDLCLTPYSILATSPTSGLVEYVSGSIPISQILANNNNSILQYFQTVAPSKSSKYSVQPDVMQTYVRSCAGYCVITYLLGVGDRHLDNIMLLPTGHFFHIDFGFIFGRDPKPLPPPFRLTREMVDGMGGIESTEYMRFCSLACQAYNLLRKSAGLVLNLLELMSDAGIEDLSNNPTSDAEGVIAKVSERFRLELTDEQAESFFLGLIGDSLAAFAPRVMEMFHQLSVARR